MPAIVAQFQAQNPGIVVELILSNQTLDLSRRDADIAIRLTNDPPETLVGRRICTARWGVYCRRDLTGGLGAAAMESIGFIGFSDNIGPLRRGDGWRRMLVQDGSSPRRIQRIVCLQLALQGLGATLLPCFLGDSIPDLDAGRLSAAGTRPWLMDADPFRSSPLGPRARLHGFRRRGAHQASTRDRGEGARGTE